MPQVSKPVKASLVPYALRVLYANLVTQQHLRPYSALPASIPGCGKHESTRRVNVYCGDIAATMAGYDCERDGTVSRIL